MAKKNPDLHATGTAKTNATPLINTATAPAPTPPARSRRLPLRTVRDVRKELRSVYLGMKAGHIDANKGTRLSMVLAEVRRCIVDSDLEERITELERKAQQ